MDNVKLAVVGCGAVTRFNHLPAISRCQGVQLTALVDSAVSRARELAARYAVPAVMENYSELAGKVDAAIVALPNHMHAPVALELLHRGIHVLVEKPMALSTRECLGLTEAANAAGKLLAVGLEFRFFDSSRIVKHLLEREFLGDITGFDLTQGVILRWPLTTNYLFQKQYAGGGVLMDFGVHVIDLLLWWLGDYRRVDYYDDAMGGVEANCELYLELQSGVRGRVELSRNRDLRNTCIIRGTRGTLEIGIWDPDPPVRLTVQGQSLALAGRVTQERTMTAQSPEKKSLQDAVRCQLEDFIDSIVHRRQPFVSGLEATRVISLIETCYASRQSLDQPWLRSAPPFAASNAH